MRGCLESSVQADRTTEGYNVWQSVNLIFFHTGDKAFGEFLFDEIKEEKKIQKSKALPKMSGGWELEMSGTEAKLTRNNAGEK